MSKSLFSIKKKLNPNFNLEKLLNIKNVCSFIITDQNMDAGNAVEMHQIIARYWHSLERNVNF